MSHLDELNNPQKEAALHMDGPLLIVAGAGAGKTKTLTHRMLNLIERGVRPENILAVTFTNKAAAEMRERVAHMVHSLAKQDSADSRRVPFVSTFHSLGVKILRENTQTLGLSRHFVIFDEKDATSLVKEAIVSLGYDPKRYEPKKIRSIISKQKGDFKTAQMMREKMASNPVFLTASSVWAKYEELLRKNHALDFDDLIIRTVLLLRENEGVRKRYQDLWKYVHIDEYQDTNEAQYEFSKLLAGDTKNICAVGDADQNIYSWRGANIKNILHFEKDYVGAKVILLEQNYRSTGNILKAANEVIKKNTERVEKNLFTSNSAGPKIGFFEGYDEREEAFFVVEKIRELKGNDTPYQEMAVLYRAGHQSRILEEVCIEQNIPYHVLGVKFFERKEVKDLLSYIRAALNPESTPDIKRIVSVPPRGIGKLTLEKMLAGNDTLLTPAVQKKVQTFRHILSEIREDLLNEKPSDAIRMLIQKSGIETWLKDGNTENEERLENMHELASLAVKYDALPVGEGIERLLEEAALMSDQDTLTGTGAGKSKAPEGVRLMTVHASKGLEFNTVFVVGLEDGLFPHRRNFEADAKKDEEERRLFYVAITRARKKLFLTHASVRTVFGSREVTIPSEFFADISEDLLEREQLFTASEGKIILID